LKYSKYITLSLYASYNTSYNTLFHCNHKAERQTSFEMKMKTHRSNSRGTLNFRFQYMLPRIIFRRQMPSYNKLNTEETR